MSRSAKALSILIALAVAAAAAGVTVTYRRDLAAARAALAGRSQVVDSPWGPLEYADVGSGPAVLMIHGSGGGFDQGLALAEPLIRRGFRVIAPSRFGYLRSAAPARASPRDQADALAWLMGRLQLKSAAIVGVSAGALSAQQLALRHPGTCSALVLVAPASYAPGRAPDQSAASNAATRAAIDAALGSDPLFWAGVRGAPGLVTRMVLATDPALVRAAPPDERDRIAATLRGILPVSARKRGIGLDSAFAGRPEAYPIDRIACPILAVSARDDLYGTAEAAIHVARRAPSARLVLYPSGGHMLVGRQAQTWAAIAGFIAPPAASAPQGG